jgi:hypothetical protein
MKGLVLKKLRNFQKLVEKTVHKSSTKFKAYFAQFMDTLFKTSTKQTINCGKKSDVVKFFMILVEPT